MPKFSYLARKSDGTKDSGVIQANSKEEAISLLQKKGLLITSLLQYEAATKSIAKPSSSGKLKTKSFKYNRVKFADLVILARQLSMLLGAGVSLLKSLEVITKQVESRKLYDVLTDVAKNMEAGQTFKDSLIKHKDVFSELWIFLVETGEASGNLPVVLDHLAKYLEDRQSFRQKIISALMYPFVLFIVAIAALMFFVIKIVPTFSSILTSINVELPLPTRILINLSNTLRKRWLFGIAILILLFFLFKKLMKNEKVKLLVEKLQLRLPVFGHFFSFMNVESFATTMSILIESGVPIIYALDICERSQPSNIMREIIHDVKVNVRDGRSLAVPLEKSGFFAPMVIQLIIIGEEIGELSEMFKRIAKFYQEYLANFVARLASLFEPIMIVFMGILIGGMVISIFLPIFNMATATAK